MSEVARTLRQRNVSDTGNGDGSVVLRRRWVGNVALSNDLRLVFLSSAERNHLVAHKLNSNRYRFFLVSFGSRGVATHDSC